MSSSSRLFQPLKVGNIELKNRIVMAPLTRFRADDNHVPLPLVTEYYGQRASVPGTLLITEATFIAPEAGGYSNVPGIYSPEQIEAWKKVTSTVHEKGSFIYMQLWALGRAADPAQLKKETGGEVKGPSDIPFQDEMKNETGGEVKSTSKIVFGTGPKPTPMTEEDIQEFIRLFAQAAKNAIEAGFDGVEIHGANGYLVDQFQQDVSNKRTDAWGGSIKKRGRFGIEVTKAVVAAVGAERTAIRLSPYSAFQGMKMADPQPQFSYFAEELKKLKLAYLHVVESRVEGSTDVEATGKIDFLIDIWGKTSPVFLAGGFRTDSAYRAVDEQYKEKDIAIVFGRYFIANPDLVFRVKEKIQFTPYDRNTFYNKGQVDGYTTWAFSKEFEAQA